MIDSVEELPIAVWEGKLFGIKVYVLSDGRRIIDADDFNALFDKITTEDLPAFSRAMAEFMKGTGDGAP